jgi:hypothetical protein
VTVIHLVEAARGLFWDVLPWLLVIAAAIVAYSLRKLT